ncbi:Uncharacterised protein [Bordetella pertussis]|nr:Uncharacterised protein [Bordetella pertussis]CFP60100.1 Uncharacterised protein [Bordetella pertussis]
MVDVCWYTICNHNGTTCCRQINAGLFTGYPSKKQPLFGRRRYRIP